MQDAEFSDEFCQFVQSTIPTVDAAELLWTLFKERESVWTPAQLAAKLRPTLNITEVEAARYLDVFQSRGLLAASANKRFRYSPSSPELALQVETLARAFGERPVTLIRMIYALRDARIRSFADAFKITRK